MKICIIFCLFLFVSKISILEAQIPVAESRPFHQGTFEVSVTGFPLDGFIDINTNTKFLYYENSAHFAAMTNVSKYLKVGLAYNYLWTRYKQETLDNYFIAGVLTRYDRFLHKNIRVYGELNVSMSDYCPCIKDVRFDNMPFKTDNIFYWGAGVGAALRIYKSLWFNIGFNEYKPLYKASKRGYFNNYGYAQPIIGLQLHY